MPDTIVRPATAATSPQDADVLLAVAHFARAATAALPRDSQARRRLSDLAIRLAIEARQRCPLTPRQLEVLALIRDGKTYDQAAYALGLSKSSVRTHLHVAYARMGVFDRAQAVLVAIRCGWIGPPTLKTTPKGD